MDFGYINIEKLTVRATVEDGPIECKVDLLPMVDGFNILRLCPLSMGSMSDNDIEKLSKEEEIKIRKEEHNIMLNIIIPLFPDNFIPIIKRLPYADFLSLVSQLMSGEKDRTEEEVISDYGKNSPQHLLWIITHPEAKKSKEISEKKS